MKRNILILIFLVSIKTPAIAQLMGGLIIPQHSFINQYPVGSVFCDSGPTAIIDVTNPTTGKTWMDRNLGATRAAISSIDTESYGDLYQWGRRADGHQCRNSATTSVLSITNYPIHGSFITNATSPRDWLSQHDINLWQGNNGINNPCPIGYRLPTIAEFNDERMSWSSNTLNGAFNSILKLPLAGNRGPSVGNLANVGNMSHLWSSTVSSNSSSYFLLITSNTTPMGSARANGASVRCIKN
jgi:hypothetical protein